MVGLTLGGDDVRGPVPRTRLSFLGCGYSMGKMRTLDKLRLNVNLMVSEEHDLIARAKKDN